MKLLLCLSALVACALALTNEEAREMLLVRSHQGKPTYAHFTAFKQYYGKNYHNYVEELARFNIFKDNMMEAKVYQDFEQGTAVYGASPHADLTTEERAKMVSAKPWDLNAFKNLPKAAIPKANAASSVDWRQKGAVTPVKNQGQCGSCWAFSTTGNIEGQWFIKNGELLSLSEQELVDCDHNGDEGCNGGLPSQAYDAIKQIGGLESEKNYPYSAADGTCSFDKSKVIATVSGGVAISTNEDDMAAWCAEHGPISIGLNANAMQWYMGGVSHPWSFLCSAKSIDHGVLIVGYGSTSSNEPYWIVKNSWGASWGEQGYYRVYRGAGTCGLNSMPTSATL